MKIVIIVEIVIIVMIVMIITVIERLPQDAAVVQKCLARDSKRSWKDIGKGQKWGQHCWGHCRLHVLLSWIPCILPVRSPPLRTSSRRSRPPRSSTQAPEARREVWEIVDCFKLYTYIYIYICTYTVLPSHTICIHTL